MSRVLNDSPGVRRRHPAGGAHRPRRARLRAPGAAARAQRRAGRPDRARAGQPDLPGVRPGHRVDAGAPAATPRCCAPRRPGGVHEDEYVEMLLRPRRLRDRLRLRPARRHHRRPRPLPARCSSAGCRSCWSTATRRASTRRSSPATTSPRCRAGRRPPGRSSGTGGSAWPSGPDRFVPVQRKIAGLPRGDAPPGSACADVERRWIERTLFGVEGGEAAAPAAARPRRARRSSAART